MAEPDDLYTLRNLFWLGNYQRAIQEGGTLSRLSEALRIEAKEYVYRSYIALGQFTLVVDEIPESPSTPVSLQAVKLLARYMGGLADKEVLLATLGDWLADEATANNLSLQLTASIIFLHEEKVKDALRWIRHGTSMEQLALSVQIFLKMDRPDLASKQVKLMQQHDEDATLSQLAAAWMHIASGTPKGYSEAASLYEELVDKFGQSLMLLNGIAVANIHMGQFDKAEKVLVDAMTQGQNDPDTLINYITCMQHLNKPPEFTQRYINQIKTAAPNHPYVAGLATVEGAFQRVSQQFSQEG